MGTKGGARRGAGRPRKHAKAEQCCAIDVRRWAREGWLEPRHGAGWSWQSPESHTQHLSIAYSVTATSVVLRFAAFGQPVEQCVRLLETACTYGGARPWWSCPSCGRRVAVLFYQEDHRGFGCRSCASISYASQAEAGPVTARRRQLKLERRLGDGLQRPKGMQLATYAELLRELGSDT